MPAHNATISFSFPDEDIAEPLKTQIAKAMHSAVQGVLDTHTKEKANLAGTASVIKADCCEKGKSA
jgi:hypothetical protein